MRVPIFVKFIVLGFLYLVSLSGCAGYKVGNQSLYNRDISTIQVPVFESESYRRNLGERLTEAVQKQIENRTPYKVVGRDTADTVLSGYIKSDEQSIKNLNDYNDTRQKQYSMTVEVRWTDRRTGNPIRQFTVNEDSYLFAESGQSLSVAQQEAIDKLAATIVEKMELYW